MKDFPMHYMVIRWNRRKTLWKCYKSCTNKEEAKHWLKCYQQWYPKDKKLFNVMYLYRNSAYVDKMW